MRLTALVFSLAWGVGGIHAQTLAQGLPRSGAGEYVVRALVAPQTESALSSAMPGRVRNVYVSLGADFKKGALLLDFFCEEQVARRSMGQAEVAAARENHEAKLRLQGLQSAAEVEVALAAAALEKARAQLTLYEVQVAQCSVKAPFEGRVARIQVKIHQAVTAGQPLIDVVSGTPPKLRLNVPSKWLAWLTRGRTFTVTIDETSRSYKARVTAINARVDAASQSIELEATVSNPGPELLPGMSGNANFDLP